MTTLLDHTGPPIWVYIVLITVGSILVLVTTAVALRCWVLRRNAKRHQESESLTGGPMRRLTVRRGRVVPTSQHLSLTGSKFGMRQFGQLADSESTLTGRRSPFEWWNTMMDRSQSRQDMSQMETASITTQPTSRATNAVARREILIDAPSQTPEKKEPVMRTWEVTLPSESDSPSPIEANRTPNFSRSFSKRGPSSPLTQRSQVTLSRISERSPHQSMISTVTGPILTTPTRSSYHSAINPQDSTPISGQQPQASPPMPRKSMTLAVPPPRNRPGQRSLPSDERSASSGLKSSSSRQRSPRKPASDARPRLSVPKPVALSISPPSPQLTLPSFGTPTPTRNSFYRQPNQSRPDVSHSRISDTSSPPASTTQLSRKSSSSIGPSGAFYDSQVPHTHSTAGYWSTRPDLHQLPTFEHNKSSSGMPHSHRSQHLSTGEERGEAVPENRFGVVTVPGKTTKVLRKKSLQRMKVVTSVAT